MTSSILIVVVFLAISYTYGCPGTTQEVGSSPTCLFCSPSLSAAEFDGGYYTINSLCSGANPSNIQCRFGNTISVGVAAGSGVYNCRLPPLKKGMYPIGLSITNGNNWLNTVADLQIIGANPSSTISNQLKEVPSNGQPIVINFPVLPGYTSVDIELVGSVDPTNIIYSPNPDSTVAESSLYIKLGSVVQGAPNTSPYVWNNFVLPAAKIYTFRIIYHNTNDLSDSSPSVYWTSFLAPEIPCYGGFCGTSSTCPNQGFIIDEIDLACKIHDECIANKGAWNDWCDFVFIEDLKKVMPVLSNNAAAQLFAKTTINTLIGVHTAVQWKTTTGKKCNCTCPMPLTTKPLTSQALTSQSLTTQALTTHELTTQALTSQALTTQPLTTQPLTTSQPCGIQANLINGGFENTVCNSVYCHITAPNNIGGWKVEAGDIDVYVASNGGWQSRGYPNSIDLNGLQAGTISQTVTLTPGSDYILNFYYAGNPSGTPSLKEFEVTIDGVDQGPFTFDASGKTYPNMGWTQKTIFFQPSSSQVKITFKSLTPGNSGPAIDSIVVQPICVTKRSSEDGGYQIRDIDSDNDGIDNGMDNCPSVSNPSQTDSDANGYGDACQSSCDNAHCRFGDQEEPNCVNGFCDCSGDPHCNSVDRSYYHLYVPGEFTALQAKIADQVLNVQLRTIGILTAELAVKMEPFGSRIEISSPLRTPKTHVLSVDSQIVSLNVGGCYRFAGGRACRTNAGYLITYDNSATVSATITHYIVAWTIGLPPNAYKKTLGMLGQWDGNKHDLYYRNGSIIPSDTVGSPKLSEAWRVQNYESLFNYQKGVPINQGNGPVIVPRPFTPQEIKNAEDMCKNVPPAFFDGCVQDVLITNDTSFIGDNIDAANFIDAASRFPMNIRAIPCDGAVFVAWDADSALPTVSWLVELLTVNGWINLYTNLQDNFFLAKNLTSLNGELIFRISSFSVDGASGPVQFVTSDPNKVPSSLTTGSASPLTTGLTPITSGRMTTSITAQQFCGSHTFNTPVGYFCNNSNSYYVCVAGSNAQSAVQQCAPGTTCRCANGVECSNGGTSAPCTL